jgi:predicted ATPase/DNA-binding NarL/FixJ family response regulator
MRSLSRWDASTPRLGFDPESRMRILIAEDNSMERLVIRRTIEGLGHECVAASTGTEAWQLFQQHGADVLISDWMMPGLDGPELCRRVRAHTGAPYTYVIFLTVLDDQEHSRYGMMAGADDYLRKPLDVDELELRLIAAQRINHLHQQLEERDAQREHTLERSEALVRLAPRIAAETDAGRLLAGLLTEMTVLVGGAAGVVWLWDAESATLVPRRSTIPQADAAGAMPPSIDMASKRAADRRAPVLLNESPDPASAVGHTPTVAVPMMHDDRLLGTIAISSLGPGKRFSPDDAHFLYRLASIGAAGLVGLEAARVQEMAPRRENQLFQLPELEGALVGRDADLERVTLELLRPDSRLLSLIGPPGVGKTALAVAVAHRLAETAGYAAKFVDLATITDPHLVSALVGEASSETGDAQVLVLDNFEHLLNAAPEVASLLAGQPRLKLLITSRAPLRVRAEQILRVEPLQAPKPTDGADVECLASSPAVALFVQRAAAVLRGFELTRWNARAVADICRRLEGLPLAIEIAAARSASLTPQVMSSRLEHPLNLLTLGEGDRPERHRTLRQAIDWSYMLLGEHAQRLFRQLAVLHNTFSLDAAEAVAPIPRQPDGSAVDDDRTVLLNALGELVEHNLLRAVSARGGVPEFQMLDVIREYALEQLEARGERADAELRHATFFAALAERAAPELRRAHQEQWLQQLDRAYPNIQAALSFVDVSGDAVQLLRFAVSLVPFWAVRTSGTDERGWLDKALNRDLPVPDRLRAQAIAGAARLAMDRRDWSTAASLSEASLRMWRDLADQRQVAESLADLAISRTHQSERSREPRALARESVAIARQLDDPWTLAYALQAQAQVALGQGKYLTAQAYFEESFRFARQAGDQLRVAIAMEGLAVAEADRQRWEQALRLAGAAERLRAKLQAELSPAQRDVLDAQVRSAREALGQEQSARVWAESQALPVEDIVAAATASAATPEPSNSPIPEALSALTRREREIARLVAGGLHNYEIADQLGITPHTTEVHVSNILSKLRMASRTQLAGWAAAHGLLTST